MVDDGFHCQFDDLHLNPAETSGFAESQQIPLNTFSDGFHWFPPEYSSVNHVQKMLHELTSTRPAKKFYIFVPVKSFASCQPGSQIFGLSHREMPLRP